jgi:hypothetical protein
LEYPTLSFLELKVANLTNKLSINEFKKKDKIKDNREILTQIREIKEQLNKLSNIRLVLMSNK